MSKFAEMNAQVTRKGIEQVLFNQLEIVESRPKLARELPELSKGKMRKMIRTYARACYASFVAQREAAETSRQQKLLTLAAKKRLRTAAEVLNAFEVPVKAKSKGKGFGSFHSVARMERTNGRF